MSFTKARLFKRCGLYIANNYKISSRFIDSTNLSTPIPSTTTENQNQTIMELIPPTQIEIKLREALEDINKEVSTLKEETFELMDKYKRSLADGENLYQRMTKQIIDAKTFGIQKFCKDLLEVADVLSKATESVPKKEVNDQNPHLKSLYEGLTLTEAQLKSVFKRHGVEPLIPNEDEKFDPNMHEALFQQYVADKEPGTIVTVTKIGYKLHERVIRPALVGVAK